MRLLNEIKSKMIIKKNLDLVFYVGDGDSKEIPSGAVMVVRIDTLHSPEIAECTSIQRAVFNLTRLVSSNVTYDELIQDMKDKEYTFVQFERDYRIEPEDDDAISEGKTVGDLITELATLNDEDDEFYFDPEPDDNDPNFNYDTFINEWGEVTVVPRD